MVNLVKNWFTRQNNKLRHIVRHEESVHEWTLTLSFKLFAVRIYSIGQAVSLTAPINRIGTCGTILMVKLV
jgi:hypothetical protein